MATFPSQFADLERFADWAIPGETNRYNKRIESSMDELQEFYDVVFPRLVESVDYLKSVSLDDISEEDERLLWLFSPSTSMAL